MNTAILTGAMVAAFSAIHILVGRLRFLDGTPRSRWLSFAGGVAVAFVFLHILPDLAAHQDEFAEGLGVSEVIAESAVNALALAGLVIFYGLERAVKLSRAASQESGAGDRTQDNVQYLHLVAYGAFNVLVGYLLLHREDTSGWGLALFFVAMALHFVTADFGMRQDNPHSYEKIGRWVIASCSCGGLGTGSCHGGQRAVSRLPFRLSCRRHRADGVEGRAT